MLRWEPSGLVVAQEAIRGARQLAALLAVRCSWLSLSTSRPGTRALPTNPWELGRKVPGRLLSCDSQRAEACVLPYTTEMRLKTRGSAMLGPSSSSHAHDELRVAPTAGTAVSAAPLALFHDALANASFGNSSRRAQHGCKKLRPLRYACKCIESASFMYTICCGHADATPLPVIPREEQYKMQWMAGRKQQEASRYPRTTEVMLLNTSY
eukprot:364743-Chlamydomonas_euryale.AAC.35